ncbi:glycosyltransferase [Vibrio breoganii]|uniref:glycosyltransferase n=1 Tax=Vibrio breoganii TaxID=553239 RepID=UPI000C825137|nr:glycosyltransferase [Vibrio breoganii]PMM86597.1 glycosyl transferase 2 family protein [Vibrio breoganii]
MNVVALVVTYKRKELLSKVLDSLCHQTHRIKDIIVVDNNSCDGTDKLVDQLAQEHDNIKYFNTGANLGGAGGFSFGFEVTKNIDYDYLWLMDDDLMPELDCLEVLLKNRPTGIAQPMRFNLDGTCAEISPVEYNLKKIFCTNPKTYTVADIYESIKNEDTIEIAGVPFEGPLINRSVIEAVGIPNPDFFIFNDDLDYSIRSRIAGFSIECIVKAKANRLLYNVQANDLKSWKGYFMLRNHFYILRKYGENTLVKNRSILISLFYVTKSLLKLDRHLLSVVTRAYFDSFKLSNNERNKPN